MLDGHQPGVRGCDLQGALGGALEVGAYIPIRRAALDRRHERLGEERGPHGQREVGRRAAQASADRDDRVPSREVLIIRQTLGDQRVDRKTLQERWFLPGEALEAADREAGEPLGHAAKAQEQGCLPAGQLVIADVHACQARSDRPGDDRRGAFGGFQVGHSASRGRGYNTSIR